MIWFWCVFTYAYCDWLLHLRSSLHSLITCDLLHYTIIDRYITNVFVVIFIWFCGQFDKLMIILSRESLFLLYVGTVYENLPFVNNASSKKNHYSYYNSHSWLHQRINTLNKLFSIMFGRTKWNSKVYLMDSWEIKFRIRRTKKQLFDNSFILYFSIKVSVLFTVL